MFFLYIFNRFLEITIENPNMVLQLSNITWIFKNIGLIRTFCFHEYHATIGVVDFFNICLTHNKNEGTFLCIIVFQLNLIKAKTLIMGRQDDSYSLTVFMHFP